MITKILALLIFLIMFVLITSGKIERYICSLSAAIAMILVVFLICMHSTEAVLESLNLLCFFNKGFWYTAHETAESSMGINWSTIVFISGMMIMVEGMAKSGFFRVICSSLAKAVNYKITSLFFVFMLLSAILSMFIDSITVILFLAAITVELAKMLKFDPVMFIIPEIFCSNLGGAATMSGDPPNIIIGTSLGYTFFDFLKNTGPIVGISLVFMMAFFYFCFRKQLHEHAENAGNITVNEGFLRGNVNKGELIISSIIFAFVVVLLVTHSITGLTVATIGVVAATLTFVFMPKDIKIIMHGFDWKTITFFIGLFVVVSGLELTGILNVLSNWIGSISGGNPTKIIVMIIWLSAVFSAIVDNIPFAATMVPVIQKLALTVPSLDLSVLAYALALGTDVGGNATPIGASANVVGTSISAENGHPITWGKYCKYTVPATIITLGIATALLFAFN